MQVYKSRKKHSLTLDYIITNLRTVETLEKRITSVNNRKSEIYHKKWNVTENKLPVQEVKNQRRHKMLFKRRGVGVGLCCVVVAFYLVVVFSSLMFCLFLCLLFICFFSSFLSAKWYVIICGNF